MAFPNVHCSCNNMEHKPIYTWEQGLWLSVGKMCAKTVHLEKLHTIKMGHKCIRQLIFASVRLFLHKADAVHLTEIERSHHLPHQSALTSMDIAAIRSICRPAGFLLPFRNISIFQRSCFKTDFGTNDQNLYLLQNHA